MAIFTVGAGQTYSTIAAAVNASASGDTVLVQAGTYTNDFVTITHALTLKSVGGLAVMQATVSPPNGKAILTVDASATVDGFGFTGASVGDANGAGIRWEGGDLTVQNSVFWNNQDGILGTVGSGHAIIKNSEFSHNGAGDGQSHNIYIGNAASLLIDGSYFHDAVTGHEIKSRAENTVITNSRIFDNAGDGSYSIDLPQGGIASITNNIIEKGASAENWISIHFGGEPQPYAASSLVVSGNTLINDNANGYLISNALDTAPVTLTANQIWGYQNSHITLGKVTVGNNTTLAARPTLDLTSLAPPVTPPVTPPVPPPTVIVTPPSAATYIDFGRAGAVTASGRILTVGAHGRYGSLATALLASKDGDTIQVAAGTYTNDFGVITHKVIIQGVGGIARFTQSPALAVVPSAILTVSADATISNIEVTGANITGHEPGIRVTAGHVTLVNDLLDNNDIGLLADPNPATTVSIYNSEIGSNGNAGTGTNNLQINQIGSFTLQNSYVHGAVSGHEIVDLAFNTVIQDSRIIDGAHVAASFLIDLGQGGNALIQGNVLDKGPDTANGVLLHVGGDGTLYDNSNVRIVGNTLASELTAAATHPYTYFIIDDTATGTVPLTVTGNTFVGGVPGSVQVTNAAATGSTTAQSVLLDTSSPVNPAAAPPPALLQTGPQVLTLKLTEIPAQIDAQYIVSIDGADIGGGWVTAKDGVDAPQTATFTGAWTPGAHSISIRATDLDPALGATEIIVRSVALDNSSVAPNTHLTSFSPSVQTTLSAAAIACYAAGTPIATPHGDVAIEHLRPGDLVLLADGGRQPVLWIGERRIDCTAHPEPETVWPVRVQANAFAQGVPHTPVRMSPEHAVFADGILIPIRHLMNGTTIVQDRVDHIHYLHVELAHHALLLAAAMPAESWLDCGNRAMFANAPPSTSRTAPPEPDPAHPGCCAPRDSSGPVVEALRERLRLQAETLGYTYVFEADLQVLADGVPLQNDDAGNGFVLPHGIGEIRLLSRTGVPAEHNAASHDRRRLGLLVGGITLRSATSTRHLALDDAALEDGFEAIEHHTGRPARWTTGNAILNAAAWHGMQGPLRLHLEIVRVHPSWATQSPNRPQAIML